MQLLTPIAKVVTSSAKFKTAVTTGLTRVLKTEKNYGGPVVKVPVKVHIVV